MIERIVGCLTATTLEEFEFQVKKAPTQILEHRVDYSQDPQLLNINYRNYEKQFIVTLRHCSQGGRFAGRSEDQANTLLALVEQGPTYIDVEVSLPPEFREQIIKKARETGVKTILSYHNYFETPPTEELAKLCHSMQQDGCDLAKVVCKAHNYGECQRLLDCQLGQINLVCFAMGQLGSYTRVVSLLYGAPLAYVALEKAVAPGQLTYDTFKMIYEVLR